MKTFKLTVTEDELKALIKYHSSIMADGYHYEPDTSERLHNLVKRLNKETPEIENDPRPEVTAAKEEQQSGW